MSAGGQPMQAPGAPATGAQPGVSYMNGVASNGQQLGPQLGAGGMGASMAAPAVAQAPQVRQHLGGYATAGNNQQNQVQNPQQFQNMLQMQHGLQSQPQSSQVQGQPAQPFQPGQGAYSPAMMYATAPQNQVNTTAGLLNGRPV